MPPPGPRAISDSWLRRFNYRITKKPKERAQWAWKRNYFALLYAYIRGDKNLVLHNDAVYVPLGDLLDRHGADEHDEVSLQWNFQPRVHVPEQLGVLQDPVVLALLEHRWRGFELRWQKLIRKGGGGVATLWEVTFEDGHKLPIVVKLGLGEQTSIGEEILWHDRYKGASNITQRLNLKELARQHRTDGRFDKRKDLEEHFRNKKTSLLILEYAEHGSLCDVLQNVETHGTEPPSIALWQLWYHMVCGAVEVAYQREFRSRWEKDVVQEMAVAEAGGPQHLEAFFEKLTRLPISHDVHFDLEENNMLMFRPHEAGSCPRLKFHDFGGWSFDMQKEWQIDDEGNFWAKRRVAKFGKFLPEQSTRDWDVLDYPDPKGCWHFTSEELEHGHPVAGRFGSWSNVFTIGRTMQFIITGYRALLPFTAKCVGEDPFPTFGWRLPSLNDSNPLDVQLRRIVAQCMYERPAHRPSLVTLLRQAVQIRQTGCMRDNDHTRQFWAKVLGLPSRPAADAVTDKTGCNGKNDDGDSDVVSKTREKRIVVDGKGLIYDDNAFKTAGRRREVNKQKRRAAQRRDTKAELPASADSLDNEQILVPATDEHSDGPSLFQSAQERQVASPEVGRRAPSPDLGNLGDDLGISIRIQKRRTSGSALKARHAADRVLVDHSSPPRRRKQRVRNAQGLDDDRKYTAAYEQREAVRSRLDRVQHEGTEAAEGAAAGMEPSSSLRSDDVDSEPELEISTPWWRKPDPSRPPHGMWW